jgi:hypothetical protein
VGLSIGQKVFNTCVEPNRWGFVTAINGNDPEIVEFDGIEEYHELWLDTVEEHALRTKG